MVILRSKHWSNTSLNKAFYLPEFYGVLRKSGLQKNPEHCHRTMASGFGSIKFTIKLHQKYVHTTKFNKQRNERRE